MQALNLGSSGEAPVVIAPTDELTLLLTVESLLFTSLSVVASLAEESHLGRMLAGGPRLFAGLASFVITLIGGAALGETWSIYAAAPLGGLSDWLTPVALGSGAVAEVLLGWWITLSLPGRHG